MKKIKNLKIAKIETEVYIFTNFKETTKDKKILWKIVYQQVRKGS